MADNNTLNFDLDAPAVPTLTLDPTPEAAEEKKPEPAPAAQQPEVQLTPEEQAMVDSFAEKIDITNSQQVLQYGSACQKKIGDFSEAALAKVSTKDLGEVGGWNFGCGSSREHAPVAIKAAGISVVIAKSFARIFYRNSINIGLPIMECPEAVDAISAGDTVSVDFTTGLITDETTGKTFQAEPFPPFIQKIIADGGLMKSIKNKK
mgnify:CR=1 FL=1